MAALGQGLIFLLTELVVSWLTLWPRDSMVMGSIPVFKQLLQEPACLIRLLAEGNRVLGLLPTIKKSPIKHRMNVSYSKTGVSGSKVVFTFMTQTWTRLR